MRSIILLFICNIIYVSSYSQWSFGNVDSGKPLRFNSNLITFSKPFKLKILGKTQLSTPTVVTLNTDNVYTEVWNVDEDPKFLSKRKLSDYLFDKLCPVFQKFPEGSYLFSPVNLVVDRNGKLVYFDILKLQPWGDGSKNDESLNVKFTGSGGDIESILQKLVDENNIDKARQTNHLEKIIDKGLETELYGELFKILSNCPKFSPAKKDGHPVHCLLSFPTEVYTVKNKKVSHKPLYTKPDRSMLKNTGKAVFRDK